MLKNCIKTVSQPAIKSRRLTMVRTLFSAACKTEKDIKYEEAVKTLNTLQTNAQTLEKIRQSRDKYAHRNIPRMVEFAERVGIQMADMDKLNVIHVSGTKGKGSTCAYCESILRHHGYKTGFFSSEQSGLQTSSPHLVEVRERFCVAGSPLEREKFASYFWEVYNLLEKSKADHNGDMPNYFGFLTVMALHVFLKEKVDVAIVEVGIGGQFDSTNLLRKPVVCGVSSLGLDHTSILGATVDKIAWHKSGIFKKDVPAFTVKQAPEAMKVIQERAAELGAPLLVSTDLQQYSATPTLGIQGSVQAVNAALAMQLCHTWMRRRRERAPEGELRSAEQCPSELVQNGVTDTYCDIPVAKPFSLTPEYLKGLEHCKWLGRNQTLSWPGITFYLDGAHTVESIQQCVDWFVVQSEKEAKEHKEVQKVLIFNTTGDRDTSGLLKPLLRCEFGSALFCPNIAYETAMSADQTNNTVTKESQLGRCHSNRHTWQKLTTSAVTNGDASDGVTNGHGPSSGLEHSITEDADVNMNNCYGNESLQTFTSIEDCINWVQRRRSVAQNGSGKILSCNGHGEKSYRQNGQSSEIDLDHSEPVIKKPKLDTNHSCENGHSGGEKSTGGELHIQVLITGSIHLVGGTLKVLWDKGGQGNAGDMG